MRVELPKALSILAHEARGSLGVIQGYLRMLRQGVADEATTNRMFQAMHDATGRLSALAREASELAAWCDGRQPEGSEVVTIDDLVGAVASGAAKKSPREVHVADDVRSAKVRSQPEGALVASLTAVTEAVAREAPGAPVALAASAASGADAVLLEIAPAVWDRAPRSQTSATFNFASGGSGLALVLASYVLDAHEVQLIPRPDDAGPGVTLQLRREVEGA